MSDRLNWHLNIKCGSEWIKKDKISKSERISLAGSHKLFLLDYGLLLSLIRDYNYKEKDPIFNLPISVVACSKQK